MIGEIINGKYKVETAFSESHMYEIFTALEVATGTTVILKILKEEMAQNADRVKGFSDEIRAFASLSHPLIAEVLDVDLFEDRPYVVVPMVKGKELHNLIKEDVMAFTDCCKIAQDLATVLQYASDQNVEYRTIKLSNVLRDTDGKLTVLSFTHPRLKLTSRSVRSENSGVHSDLFFLGSTFFELMAGESPIRKRGGINELWDMKLEKLLRIRHPDLAPEQLSRIVDFVKRALTRDMSHRFNSHEEFLKSLADLSGVIRSTTIRNKSRQLSMASQVVDALNGRMSNVNMNMPTPANQAQPYRVAASASAMASSEEKHEDNSMDNGFAETRVEGNLALVVDNSSRDSSGDTSVENEGPRPAARPKLRLVKSDKTPAPAAEPAWNNAEDHHWLRNPVIFMGICLVVMVFLILFW